MEGVADVSVGVDPVKVSLPIATELVASVKEPFAMVKLPYVPLADPLGGSLITTSCAYPAPSYTDPQK